MNELFVRALVNHFKAVFKNTNVFTPEETELKQSYMDGIGVSLQIYMNDMRPNERARVREIVTEMNGDTIFENG